MTTRLRVGLLVDSFAVPNWVASIVADVKASDAAEIVVVVINGSVRKGHGILPLYQPRLNPFRLSELYLYLDCRLFRPVRDAVEPVDLRPRLNGCSVVESEPVYDKAFFSFNEQDERRLHQCNLDVLLMFWSGLPADQVASMARHGVWFFLDHERMFTGRPPVGFWEVLHQRPVMMQCLKAQVASSPDPLRLHQYVGPTNLRSIRLSRNNLLWKSASFVSRKLGDLHRLTYLDSLPNAASCADGLTPDADASNLSLVKPIASRVTEFVRRRVTERRYLDQWVMAYKFCSSPNIFDRNLADYHRLVPPKDRYWADPFPVQVGDRYFLFFEEFLYSTGQGHLCVAEIDRHGLKEEPRIVLKRDYHLSYPFVFQWGQNWFLIPESQAAGRIDLYRFDPFPYRVSHYKTLMHDVSAADATLVEAGGRWWMFVAIAAHDTWNVDELFLFHADTPCGPWMPHPKNPIKSDVRCARPAGRVFARQGKYYRPTQDCSRTYGYAVRLQEITALSETEYAEEEVSAIFPGWSPDIVATHTLNFAGTLTVIDAQQRRRR